MNSERIIEILNGWNFWEKEIDVGVIRQPYLSQILPSIRSGKVISLIGVRRSGKSTLMRQIARELIKSGTHKNNTLFVNFEEPQLEGTNLESLLNLYQAYLEIIRPKGKPFIFLDEIQNVPGWERFVRSLNEKKEAHLIVSGSSGKLTSRELADRLTGRQVYFYLTPLSFAEFLSFKGLQLKSKRDLLVNSLEIRKFFRDYARWGGFPEIVLNEDEEFKKRILASYYEDIVYRDMAQRFKVKKIEQIKSLTRFYLTNISCHITFNSIGKFLKLPVETVKRFSSYIELCNLIFFLKRFSFSVKEQENSARKVYSIDTGLSGAVGFKFSDDFGRVAENLVALKLKLRQSLLPFQEIYYWKNHYGDKEIDFLIKEGKEIKQLIQVCWDISDERTRKREISSLLKSSDELHLPGGIILAEKEDGEEKINGKRVVYRSLWKWLLETP